MALFKCKMCGGALEIAAGETVATCEYCGTQQTLPNLDDDKRANMYDRANHFRRNNEFDKATGIYEQILNEDNTDAEAYWSLVLCRYGIEYVEDPASHKRIPTVNRAQFTSIFDDDNYKSALQYADSYQRSIYEAEAKAINEIQKGILAISQKEEPFDVFICYKESDNNGRRTPDSVLANDLYHQLTQEGFKVFFARITLEDKLGSAYEPYIFAALNSAKVMVVLGTKPEYFNAVWVKNEWSRYLALIKNGAKKMLIPAYKDMDPYDLPEEFSHLQAQDMGKLGFMQDLIRGIKKITAVEEPTATVVKETVVATGNANSAPLLKRAFMFLEDRDWNSANEYCEKVLDIDPENAQAYLGKLMCELQVQNHEDLKHCDLPFDNSNNYKKAIRFGNDSLRKALIGCIEYINERNENTRLENIYTEATSIKESANSEGSYMIAAQMFEEIQHYKDSANLAQECSEAAEIARKDAILKQAKGLMNGLIGNKIDNHKSAIELFESIPGWHDADEQLVICQQKLEELIEKEKQAKIEAEIELKKTRKFTAIVLAILAVGIAIYALVNSVIIPAVKYNKAVNLMEAGQNYEAASIFISLYDYKDSDKQALACWDEIAQRNTIAAGVFNTVGIRADNTVAAVGDNEEDQCQVGDWGNIVSVDAGYYHTVGLRADGTVVAVGDNSYYQCRLVHWDNIVAVDAGYWHTVGLQVDGTVLADGRNDESQCEVRSWTDITGVAAGFWHTAGVRTDGTVVAVGSNEHGQLDVETWTDVVAIAAGAGHTVGLRADGTVVAVGDNSYGQCSVETWSEIVAVSAGYNHTVGLRADGTVVAVGSDQYRKCAVTTWTDIVAIAAGGNHTVGLRADGTIVAIGDSLLGQCAAKKWTDIKLPTNVSTTVEP